MQNRFLGLVVGLSVLFFSLLATYASGQGTTAAVILIQPIGARASGMGEAVTSIGGDICGLHYNPASLGRLTNKEVSFSLHRGIADDYFGTLIFGLPTKMGIFALSFVYYNAGDMVLIDWSGNERKVNALTDYLLTLSFSRKMTEGLSIGFSTKVLNSTIVDEFSAVAFAVDFGGQYRISKIGLGLSIQNIGTGLKYIEDNAPLPLIFRLGVSYDFDPGLIVFDIIRQVDEIKANIGLEYWYHKLFAIRFGYRYRDMTSFSSGLGFAINNTGIDYSIMVSNDLGLIHRIGLNQSF
ncbi:PorV/PorQ family protein [candidate division WOR-3 bacterium]|nr:PorV/PorQ family protein [candidate division WOR-3 bacterium]